MFVLGAFIVLSWVFCHFYYGDLIPQNISVGMIIGGLFTMGWGLLTGKR